MPLQIAFWMVMLLWLISGFIPEQPGRPWVKYAGPVLQFLLFAALGWRVFGEAITS